MTCVLPEAFSASIFSISNSSCVFCAGFSICLAIAAILGLGGGKVILPSRITVAPLITSSSILVKGTPFFSGVKSSSI